MEQRSPEWLEARKKRITASIAGAILGHSPSMTRNDAMRSMVRDALGADQEFTGNVATQWGEGNEAGAVRSFEMITGIKADPCGFFTFKDWLGASPDGLTPEGEPLEVKCPYRFRKERKPDFQSIYDMPHYYDQVQVQMLCTGAWNAHFFQWSPYGEKYEIVPFSQPWANENLPKLRQFYAEFLHELENNSEEYLNPKRAEFDTAEAHRMVREWDEIKEQIELLEERKKDLLTSMVEGAKGKDAVFAGRKLTKVIRAGSVSYAKVVKEHLPGLDLEPYRGNSSEYWKLT